MDTTNPLTLDTYTPLPVSTSIDPRLQAQPKHSIGPWPLSRNVSSSSSASGLRTRSSTLSSRYNSISAAHSPGVDGSSANPLEEIHETHEVMHDIPLGDEVMVEEVKNHNSAAFDVAEVEEALETTFGYAQADESTIEIHTSEEALKRSIFSGSLSTALAHELSPSSSLSQTHRRSQTLPTTFLQSPSTSTLILSHPHLSHTLYGSIHSRTASDLILTLPLKPARNSRPEPYSSSPVSAFTHLNVGDPIILLTRPPPPSPTNLPNPPRHRPLLSHLPTLSLLLFLAPPPAMFFLFRPSSPAPSRTAYNSSSYYILLAFLMANAGVFGGLLAVVGRWTMEGRARRKSTETKERGRDRYVEDGDAEDDTVKVDVEEIEEVERADVKSLCSDLESRSRSKPGFWGRPLEDPRSFAIPLAANLLCAVWYYIWVENLVNKLQQ